MPLNKQTPLEKVLASVPTTQTLYVRDMNKRTENSNPRTLNYGHMRMVCSILIPMVPVRDSNVGIMKG